MKKFLFLFIAVAAAFGAGISMVDAETAATGISLAFFFPLAVDAHRARQVYRAINIAAKEFGILAAPSHLRSEVAVSNSTSTYSFPIRDVLMNKTTFPQSKGVLDNDIFVTIGQGILWDNRTSGTGKIQLQSYPNPYVATAAGITTADLYTLYSGLFNVQVGSTEFIKQFDSAEFLTVPQAQQTSATDNTQFDISAAIKVMGAYPLYSGKADNKVTLTVNTSPSLDIVGDSGQTVLTYFAKGVLLNNGANITMKKQSKISGQQVDFYTYLLEVLEQLG